MARSASMLRLFVRINGLGKATLGDEAREQAALLHQLAELAPLDDAALVEDEDTVRIRHRREPVRDDEGRAPLAQRIERPLDLALGLGIERARRLVEDQDRRILQDGARNGDALAFAARKRLAPFADHELIAARLLHDEVVGFGQPRRALDFRIGRIRAPDADVFGNGAVEEAGILEHHRDRVAQATTA